MDTDALLHLYAMLSRHVTNLQSDIESRDMTITTLRTELIELDAKYQEAIGSSDGSQ